MTGAPEIVFRDAAFRARPEGFGQFLDLIARRLPSDRETSVLEIGCGTGTLLLELAARFPRARCLGVDISGDNIRQARAAADATAQGGRVRFEAGDYMARDDGPFDLVCAASTLHLIDAPLRDLFAKIASDLRPGGLLAASLPDGGLYNRALCLARQGVRRLRGPAFEACVLALAGLAYGKAFGREALRDRIPYIYVIPRFLLTGRLKAELARTWGLAVLFAAPERPRYLGKPRHDLVLWRRGPEPAGGGEGAA